MGGIIGSKSGRSAAWLTIQASNPTGNNPIDYSVSQFNGRQETGNKRSTTSIVSGAAGDRTVYINQTGRPLYVAFDPINYSVAAAGASASNPLLLTGRTNAKTLTFSIGSGAFIELKEDGSKNVVYKQHDGTSPTGTYIISGNGPTGDPGLTDEWMFCIEIIVDENTSLSSRSATVVVSALGTDTTATPVTSTATITQSSGSSYLWLEETNQTEVTLTFAWNETTSQTVDVLSNDQWSVS